MERVIAEGALEEKTIHVDTDQPIWAIGLMSGTSMDGVDAAALQTDGQSIFAFGPSAARDFGWADPHDIREAMQQTVEALDVPSDLTRRLHAAGDMNDCFMKLAGELEADYRDAVLDLARTDLCAETNEMSLWLRDTDDCRFDERLVGALGVHGQTLGHRPEENFTLQVASGAATGIALAKQLGVATVTDFRTSDVQAGGQGAPLAPFYHFALAKRIGASEPLAFLNIGGVANVTWVEPSKEVPEEDGALLAFDTGPGNALINDWMQARVEAPMDRDGAAAENGRVHRDRLNTNSGQAYLRKPGPKSLDRNDFHGVLGAMEGLTIDDGAATLTAFTVHCVASSIRHMPSPPSRWLVCGGGRLNKTMMRMLADRLDAPVDPVEVVGLDGDMLEAQAFAYLAVRVLRGLPTSAPSTTGCREPVCGGRVAYP